MITESEAHCRENFDYMSPEALMSHFTAGRNLLIGLSSLQSAQTQTDEHGLTACKVFQSRRRSVVQKISFITFLENFKQKSDI